MKGLRKVLTPFAPDQSGAVGVLYEFGALIVVIDAGGCTGNICGFDEPRWQVSSSAVFSAGLRDMDAILGRDELLVKKIAKAHEAIDVKFTALVGTPVPAVIATGFFDCSYLRADVLMAVAAVLALSASTFPKARKGEKNG